MIAASLLRKVVLFLEDCTYQPTVAGSLAASLRRCGVGRPRKSAAPARARRESKRKAHRDEMAALREAVFARATRNGYTHCESCGGSRSSFELDHWLSGSGRRRAEQSIQTLWVLCALCHQNRTRNVPSADEWNRRFSVHCAEHGYPFRPHVVHAPVEARR